MIKIFKQDMFSIPSEAIVVPCDNLGNLSYMVMQNLKNLGVDGFSTVISSGDIACVTVERYSKNLSIIFAAAVEDDDGWGFSCVGLIEGILAKVDAYAKENRLSCVNIPLIGTGAGGLSEEVVAKLMADHLQKSSVCYNVCTLSNNSYERIQSFFGTKQGGLDIKNPRVFVSYASNNKTNEEEVLNLIKKLRENGVNARSAMFHLPYGADLPQWMTDEIVLADKVLLICDKYYVSKSDARKGGVGWETMIIQGDMLSNANCNKYIAIVKDDWECGSPVDINKVPLFMKSKYYLEWSVVENHFDTLLEVLFNINEEPPLGAVPQQIVDRILMNQR